MKLRERILDLEQGAGSAEFLIEGKWRLSYSEAIEGSARFQGYLCREGFGVGDRLAVALTHDGELATVFIACLRAGVVPVFLDPQSTRREVLEVLRETKAKMFLVEKELLEAWGGTEEIGCDRVLKAVSSTGSKTLMSRWLGKKKEELSDEASYPKCYAEVPRASFDPTAVGEEAEGLVLHTSGTTGGAKLVSLSLRNLADQGEVMSTRLRIGESSRVLNLIPLSHFDGIVSGVLVALWSGSTLVRLEPFTIPRLAEVLASIYRQRVTHLMAVPTMLSLILRDGDEARRAFDGEEFERIVSTGSALAPSLWTQFEEVTGKTVVNMYGLSEVGNLFFAGPDESSRKVGTVGFQASGGSRIVDEQGVDVVHGEEGELMISGPSVMVGYLDRESPIREIGEERWFATGDLVVREESGHLRIVGRKKDVIITGGNNVAPEEVNQVLLAQDGVEEAATLGVPDPIWGERIVSCVVLSEGAPPKAEILESLGGELTSYKLPRELHEFASLPKGRSGKVKVGELVQMISAKDKPLDSPFGDLEERVLRVASESFRVSSSTLSRSTVPDSCSGWDSMAHLDLVCNLEEEFRITVSPREAMSMQSLGAVVDIVQRHAVEG